MTEHRRFGDIEIHPLEREVKIDGKPARLGARAYDVLFALIERRERVVSKNELLDLVWPGLVVEENNLQVQISALRKLLGSNAITTIPGRGYRFTLREDGDDTAPETITSAPSSAPSPPLPNGPFAALGNLPDLLPTLYGRDADLRALLSLPRTTRLVTIAGAGGIGKTPAGAGAGARAARRLGGPRLDDRSGFHRRPESRPGRDCPGDGAVVAGTRTDARRTP